MSNFMCKNSPMVDNHSRTKLVVNEGGSRMAKLEVDEEPENPTVSPGSGRFRVDRIDSVEAGCHQAQLHQHPQDHRPNPLSSSIVSSIPDSTTTLIKRVKGSVIVEEDEGQEEDEVYSTPLKLSNYSRKDYHGGLVIGAEVDLQETTFSITENNNYYKNQWDPCSSRSQSLINKTNKNSHNSHLVRFNSEKMAASRKISHSLSPHNITRRKSSVFIPSGQDDYDLLGGIANQSTIGLYGKSLHHYTQDALPKMANYRNLMSIQAQAANRPTLDELHDEEIASKEISTPDETNATPVESSVKFGWIEGCLVRCLLNIWGVMLFLRLSWMVAQSGIIHTMIIIGISTVVTSVTTLSMSAASTNGEIKGGGIYYMISRSLGPEFGGAVGVVFSFANSAMAALNIVGFSESMISLLRDNGLLIIDGAANDNRIISCITICVLQSIIIIGMEWEAKAQMGLLVILLVAMGDFVIGAFMGPQTDLQKSEGWLGLNGTTFVNNLKPAYIQTDGIQQDFFSIFSIFFPAVSGIQAGVSISGDLKDPAEAIPKGTLLAIAITSTSYALFALLAAAGTLREATGNVTQLEDWSFTNCSDHNPCHYGMYYDYNVMGLMSIFGPLIYAGCFAACLSSALSCLVSGPKTFQALCKDEVYPYVKRFGIGYRKSDDPFWGYALGFVIAIIFILIADLNAIAPLISNFFMVAYALLNYCTFHASLIKPLGWRPTFKYCNAWVSLFGAIICVIVMFLMSWQTALISLGVVVFLYSFVLYRKPEVNWGTSVQAQTYTSALTALQTLVTQSEHVKNYRPQILCLSGFPSNRPALVEFGYLLTKKNSLLLCANINEDKVPSRYRRLLVQKGYDWLREKKFKSFYVMVDDCKFDEGCQVLLQSSGIGKLAPNILLMGYKINWQICHPSEVVEYFNCLHTALDNHLAIAILRLQDGLDISDAFGHTDLIAKGAIPSVDGDTSMMTSSAGGFSPDISGNNSFATTNGNGATTNLDSSPSSAKRNGNKSLFSKSSEGVGGSNVDMNGVYRDRDETEAPEIPYHSFFNSKQGKGIVDVYWLYDDGGLTLLLPYIITMRKKWSQCKLRVFALANKASETEVEYRSMASLLSKFRIDYSDLTVIPDITRKADAKTRELFDSLIKDYVTDGDKDDSEATAAEEASAAGVITEAELLGLKEKTNRHLRLRELLLEHSTKSNLIVMTLPVPRKGVIPSFLYMAWLEILTKDMPPFLLVRGNQASVLTFYS